MEAAGRRLQLLVVPPFTRYFGMHNTPVLTFSHLRWDFVYQRPQHVMSRLGAVRPVLYVEEPLLRDGPPALEITSVAPGVRVAQPFLSLDGTPFGSDQEPLLEPLLRAQLQDEGWKDFVAWLYTPMAVRIAKALHPRAIVYDCMDELTGFLDAPAELQERERELLAAAEAVMTGGPSLYRAKKDRHAFVRCYPSSVDVDHFARNGNTIPADQACLPRPWLGYCGVIDERMDLAILKRLASERPDWQIILLGPVVKIDPATLPRAQNLHYLGKKDYHELPAYIGGWDVALMPFAIGPATRYISPTKVLEYMAAERPIVSTPITDVVEPYGDIVYVGEGPDGFLRACASALSSTPFEREDRKRRARDVLRRTSWDETTRSMNLIVHCLADALPSQEVASGATTQGPGGSA
jgi:UDP-galactopyranose mutase